MPRPEKERRVLQPPVIHDFKPTGIPKRFLESLELSLDEYEAIRLTDYLGLDHGRAAEEMAISRPTFTRLVEKARQKMAVFLVEGVHLKIEGGTVHFQENLMRCQECRNVFEIALTNGIEKCPSCGSTKVVDLAAHFGHGNCCEPVPAQQKNNPVQ
jgi:predicted DNA-binding protein (UPF0251 family)